MLVHQFLAWSQTAPEELRAQGARALAQAYLYEDLSLSERQAAHLALTSFLEDSSLAVRRALAESLACAPHAPRHLIFTLARDDSRISSLILYHSPVLQDADLVACLAQADPFAQAALALRAPLSSTVTTALTQRGGREALISLAVNPDADLTEESMHHILERFGEDGEIREALLTRENLPPSIRAHILTLTARALEKFILHQKWMNKERSDYFFRTLIDRTHLLLTPPSSSASCSLSSSLVTYWRKESLLTPRFLLRALLSGQQDVWISSLQALTGLSLPKIANFLKDWNGIGFSTLYQKSGLPSSLFSIFQCALEATHHFSSLLHDQKGQVSRLLIEYVLKHCRDLDKTEQDSVRTLLYAFEAEAFQNEAQAARASLNLIQTEAPALEIVAEPCLSSEEPAASFFDFERSSFLNQRPIEASSLSPLPSQKRKDDLLEETLPSTQTIPLPPPLAVTDLDMIECHEVAVDEIKVDLSALEKEILALPLFESLEPVASPLSPASLQAA